MPGLGAGRRGLWLWWLGRIEDLFAEGPVRDGVGVPIHGGGREGVDEKVSKAGEADPLHRSAGGGVRGVPRERTLVESELFLTELLRRAMQAGKRRAVVVVCGEATLEEAETLT